MISAHFKILVGAVVVGVEIQSKRKLKFKSQLEKL